MVNNLARRLGIAVTVITWVLWDFTPLVVQTLVAWEKTPYVTPSQTQTHTLAQSVATHGHGISLVLIVTNFHRESWLATIGHVWNCRI